MVGRRGADLLRRHVARGAEDHPDFGVRNTDRDRRGLGEHRGLGDRADRRCDLGEAEVEDLDAPSRVMKTLSGLRSRWTMPLSWAAPSPRANCAAISDALRGGIGEPSIRSRNVSPSSSSETT